MAQDQMQRKIGVSFMRDAGTVRAWFLAFMAVVRDSGVFEMSGVLGRVVPVRYAVAFGVLPWRKVLRSCERRTEKSCIKTSVTFDSPPV